MYVTYFLAKPCIFSQIPKHINKKHITSRNLCVQFTVYQSFQICRFWEFKPCHKFCNKQNLTQPQWDFISFRNIFLSTHSCQFSWCSLSIATVSISSKFYYNRLSQTCPRPSCRKQFVPWFNVPMSLSLSREHICISWTHCREFCREFYIPKNVLFTVSAPIRSI